MRKNEFYTNFIIKQLFQVPFLFPCIKETIAVAKFIMLLDFHHLIEIEFLTFHRISSIKMLNGFKLNNAMLVEFHEKWFIDSQLHTQIGMMILLCCQYMTD